MPGMVCIPLGLLDEAEDLKPDVEVWTAEKLPWLIAEGAVESAGGRRIRASDHDLSPPWRSPRRTMRNRRDPQLRRFLWPGPASDPHRADVFWLVVPRERLTELSVFASPMRDFGGGPLAVLDFLSPFEQVAAAAIWAMPIWL